MPKALSIATFNLLNLALPGQITHTRSKPIDDKTYASKKRWIAGKLGEIDADLIGFQEVWSKRALADCFAEAGLDQKYDLVARDAKPGLVQVAAAVRKGIRITNPPKTHWIEDFPKATRLIKRPPKRGEPLNTMSVDIRKFSRPVLNLELTLDRSTKLRFFVIHLKSKLAMELDSAEFRNSSVKPHATALGEALSAIRRTAEVAALRVWLNIETKGTRTPIAVVGDLNDGHLTTTAAILSGQPPVKLFAASPIGKKPTKGGDLGLYSAQMLQEYRSLRDVYYTYDHKNIMESLDHVFVSEEFYEHSPHRIWTFRELRILNDHIHFRADNDRVTSDHGIVVVKFDAAK
jgi:predicted extracellular nuclease